MYDSLPVTGPATIALGGLALGQGTLALVALGLIAAGATIIRFTYRRRRPLGAR